VFDRVQAMLALKTRRIMINQSRPDHSALFKGRLFDMDGVAMTPTTARGKSGQVFRYYVSSNVQRNRPTPGSPEAIRRVPALSLERMIRQIAARMLPLAEDPVHAISRIEIHPHEVHIGFNPRTLASDERAKDLLFDAMAARVEQGERFDPDSKVWWLRIARRLKFRGGKSTFTAGGIQPATLDPVLARAIHKGHALLKDCTGSNGRLTKAPSDPHERMLIRLAFLAPDIQAAVFAGQQPQNLSLEALRFAPIPLAWDDQRAAFCD